MADDELRDMAASACQEALSFGVNEDAFMKLARSVREQCARRAETMPIRPGESAVEFSKRLAANLRGA